MALVSPGVEVSVIDESFYTPAAGGTVPMIFVATASNKLSSSGTGTASGTTKANAGKPYLITSQRELGETFGDPLFYSDASGNMIHGGELNEYGLQAAYSSLGVSNRAYVVRADIDLAELEASATAPGGAPADGAWWLDTLASEFGILEWNGDAITTVGGQTFSSKTHIAITSSDDLDGSDLPTQAIGAIGDYAIDHSSNDNRVFYKSPGYGASQATRTANAGKWVALGSNEWADSYPAATGTSAPAAVDATHTIVLNGVSVVAGGTTFTDVVTAINNAAVTGINAALIDSRIKIYVDATAIDDEGGSGTTATGTVSIAEGTGTLVANLGLTAGTYSAPRVQIAPHTSVPTFKSSDTSPAPTGSVWLKTTQPNGGANISVKQYSAAGAVWNKVITPIFSRPEQAIYGLDPTGGGTNITVDSLFADVNVNGTTPPIADFKIYRRSAIGATVITSSKVSSTGIAAATYTFTIAETTAASASKTSPVTVSVTTAADIADADTLAGQINAAGLTNVIAVVDAQNRVQISHKLGGEIDLVDTDGGLALFGFSASAGGTTNLYFAPGTTAATSPKQFVASNWAPLTYTASNSAPLSLTAQGALWYNSIVDEVDIMVHNGETWVGLAYDGASGESSIASPFSGTDPQGPIVSAAEPTTQADGASALVTGDIWVSTASVEDYPVIYKYNATIAATGASGWILVDNADQTTEDGILFGDARYGDTGGTTLVAPSATIAEMVTSDYLDPDAPDPALYPRGMLLWNTRRSGFNVKRFERNYVNTNGTNGRYGDLSMSNYYPHRWVTDSGNNEDGSGTFGRHAQRKSVVQALQALVNSNQEIRDEESRQFNLMASPGYPELIGEMITLNTDRRLTSFVVGDTPFRLTPDATSLNEWASNVKLAVEDNDNGAVSFDEYMAMYYGAGFTSDNFGNNIVVPPSHMALRTIILNDQVAFPWFAPAGTRRGGVSNATSSGYINNEGEFVSVALNTGQRDTLYSNKINPITFLSGAGLVVFGQKTRARNASALDRVNVARLTVYLRGQLELLAKPYLFEPNDKITRDQIKAAADALLLELVALRAVYDYLVVCDESNNTAARIDRNELYLDVAIEPVKAIEFIYIPLRLKNTGEIAALG